MHLRGEGSCPNSGRDGPGPPCPEAHPTSPRMPWHGGTAVTLGRHVLPRAGDAKAPSHGELGGAQEGGWGGCGMVPGGPGVSLPLLLPSLPSPFPFYHHSLRVAT